MKINFIFSHQYNNALGEKSADFDWEFIQKRIEQMEKFWSKNGNKIVNSLQRILKIKFSSKPLICYMNTKATISDPLSLRIEDIHDMQDNLIHELVHVLLTQNYSSNKKFSKSWDTFYKNEFQDESNLTRTHLIIHSVHELLTKSLFPKRLKNIKAYSNYPEYVRSWKIVSELGTEKILSLIVKT